MAPQTANVDLKSKKHDLCLDMEMKESCPELRQGMTGIQEGDEEGIERGRLMGPKAEAGRSNRFQCSIAERSAALMVMCSTLSEELEEVLTDPK